MLSVPALFAQPEPHELKLLPQRLREKIVINEHGCWIFTGRLDKDGYGQIWPSSRNKHKDDGIHSDRVHRVTYELLRGPIPNGLEPDHTCSTYSVKACCNPFHLELVTGKENKRRRSSIITHCRNGHPLDKISSKGRRYCSICQRESAQRFAERKRRGVTAFVRANAKAPKPQITRLKVIKTHCKRGHLIEGQQTGRDGKLKRLCLVCAADTKRRWKQKQRQEKA